MWKVFSLSLCHGNKKCIRFESERWDRLCVRVCIMNQIRSTEVSFSGLCLQTFFVVNRLQKTETSLYLCVSPDLCSFSSINADKSLSLPSSGELWFLKGFCMFPMPLSVYVEENNISARNKRQIAKDIERKSAKTIAASEAHTDLYKNETGPKCIHRFIPSSSF